MSYRALLVDDEKEANDFLSASLKETCPDIQIAGTATGSKQAIEEFTRLQPDVMFVDIQIDEMNGLEVVEEIYSGGGHPYIIFVTAFDRHAIDAFKKNAVDYLLKPVDMDDLKRACSKFRELFQKDRQYEHLRRFIDASGKKIRFNTRSGFFLFAPDDIFYLEANQNYTKIYTGTEQSEMVSMNLGSVEKMLPADQFWRVSKSSIINLKYLFRVDRKKRECILRTGEKEISLRLSRDRIKDLPV